MLCEGYWNSHPHWKAVTFTSIVGDVERASMLFSRDDREPEDDEDYDDRNDGVEDLDCTVVLELARHLVASSPVPDDRPDHEQRYQSAHHDRGDERPGIHEELVMALGRAPAVTPECRQAATPEHDREGQRAGAEGEAPKRAPADLGGVRCVGGRAARPSRCGPGRSRQGRWGPRRWGPLAASSGRH